MSTRKILSASFTNKSKLPKSEETKKKISASLIKTFCTQNPEYNSKLSVKEKNDRYQKSYRLKKFTTVDKNCLICNCLITLKREYCESCYPNIELYKKRCSFKFNVYHFPKEFDIELLNRRGWYSPNGRKSTAETVNKEGVSRDHMYSVFEGFINRKDPRILSHPANCRIMIHNGPDGNNSKKTKSIISWEELLTRIAEWDIRYK